MIKLEITGSKFDTLEEISEVLHQMDGIKAVESNGDSNPSISITCSSGLIYDGHLENGAFILSTTLFPVGGDPITERVDRIKQIALAVSNEDNTEAIAAYFAKYGYGAIDKASRNEKVIEGWLYRIKGGSIPSRGTNRSVEQLFYRDLAEELEVSLKSVSPTMYQRIMVSLKTRLPIDPEAGTRKMTDKECYEFGHPRPDCSSPCFCGIVPAHAGS